VDGTEPSDDLFFRGVACFELGRLREAEQALRQTLSQQTRPQFKVLCRNQLGRVLMEQDRWNESAPCFREALRNHPRAAAVIAPWPRCCCVPADRMTPRSIRHAKRWSWTARRPASEKGRAGGLQLESQRIARVSRMGARQEPDRPRGIRERALGCIVSLVKLAVAIRAEIHFCAGHAYDTRGNSTQSVRHFERATEIALDGNYGRLSRSAAPR
jgi:tetratricopeptide (TPR) repeat protein